MARCSRCEQLKDRTIDTAAWRLKHKDHGGITVGKPIQAPSYQIVRLVCRCGAQHFHLDKEDRK